MDNQYLCRTCLGKLVKQAQKTGKGVRLKGLKRNTDRRRRCLFDKRKARYVLVGVSSNNLLKRIK